jgi:DNA polymerase III alpha subunit
VGHIPEVLSRLQEIGSKVAPITDRLSTFGFVRWTKAAKKVGLKPIYGVELAVVPELGAAKPIADYWTFIALDSLRPLHDLIYLATNNPGKEPSLTYKQALAGAEAGLAAIAGERLLLSSLPSSIPGQFYWALAPSSSKGLARAVAERGIPMIASGDNYFPRREDEELYRVALEWRSGTQTYPRHILSDDEWMEATARVASPEQQAEALRHRGVLADRATVEMRKARLLVPEKPATLRKLCEIGAKRKGVSLRDPVYKERLKRELDLIKEKQFEDYFYILADLIGWAKQRMIVGPARGSSCGSLVCYLLDITAIDPIPYGLIFERFIDVNRKDLPDIDVDFSDARRPLVFDYVEERYGKDRAARLGTVGLFKARSAVKQAGKSLRIPEWRTDKVLDSIIERSSGDSRAMNALEDTFNETEAGRALKADHPELMIAARMEGHPNVPSQHAAGVVITEDPLVEYVAVDARTKAVWCDKKDSEELNLLKIDALGLTQLSIFERCLELMGEQPISGWLEKIPLDDPAAFAILNNKHYSGLFQFTGMSMRKLAGMFKFTHINDIVAATALARPGPIASGGANAWVRRKNGQEEPTPLHPMLTDLTKETYGVVVFQETVMRIVREMGRMSWEDTSAIRKAMSGTLGDEFFAKYWVKFLAGALENGIDETTAKLVWDQINTFGSWSFNKSHAVAYGIVSYWCCWLKAHHPIEFAAATLDAEADSGKQIALLRELAAEGIEYVPIDPDHSTDRWTPAKKDGKTVLVGPLTAIKGIGPAKMRTIIECRASGEALPVGIAKQLANATTALDSLFPIADAVKRIHPDISTSANIVTRPINAIEVQCGVPGEVMVFALIKKVMPRDENDSANVQKRGGKRYSGPTQALNLFVADDTDEIFCKVDRFAFEKIGRKMMETARAGKSLYAIKGTIPRNFRMISINSVRYLGEIDK